MAASTGERRGLAQRRAPPGRGGAARGGRHRADAAVARAHGGARERGHTHPSAARGRLQPPGAAGCWSAPAPARDPRAPPAAPRGLPGAQREGAGLQHRRRERLHALPGRRHGERAQGRGTGARTSSLCSCDTAASLPPQGIFISRIAEGGAAHRAGTLQVGDRVLSVSQVVGAPAHPRRHPLGLLTAAPSQINGVDMTEARHDHAVSLLTAASPTIALLLEREAGGPLSPSPPPHSPVLPAVAPTTVVTATPAGPGPLRLAPSLLAAALEGPYPVEVRPHPPTHSTHVACTPAAEAGGGRSAPGCRALAECSILSPWAPPTPGAAALALPSGWRGAPSAADRLAHPSRPRFPQEICLPRAGGPLGLSVVGGSDHSSHPFGAQEPGVFISKVGGPRPLQGGHRACPLSAPAGWALGLCTERPCRVGTGPAH